MDKHREHILRGSLGTGIFRFGLPLAVAMGLQACFNLTDLFIIGKLPNGVEAIGALAICDMLAVLGTILAQGISNASVGVIGRFFGGRDRSRLNHATWTSLTIILILSAGYGLIGLVGAHFLIGDLVGAHGPVREIAVTYLQILVGNSWTIFFLMHLTAVMRAMGRSKLPAVILIGANLVNILLDILMVYGPGPSPAYFEWAGSIAGFLGIGRMEVNGAAWATVISRGLGCAIAFVALLRFKEGPRFLWSEVKPSGRELWRLIRIGTPSSAQLIIRVSSYVVCLSLIARYFASPQDSSVLAAFGICIRLDTLALFVGLGWGAAASSYVGINLGGGSVPRAVRSGWIASFWNASFMLGLAAAYLLFSESIIGIFNNDPEVMRSGREYLWVVGLTYAPVGFAIVLSQALQGATETVSSFVIDASLILVLQIPLLILLVAVFHLDRQFIWYGLAGTNVVSAIVYSLWYSLGRWTTRPV
ncbi:MAG: MATE family efflux transporter [Bradymonadales bacterium]|nr:MATE family efflux transporter [Bradymonadales bacterium]